MKTELHILQREESQERIVDCVQWDVGNGCLWFVTDDEDGRKRTAIPLHTIDHFWMPLPPLEPDPWEPQ